MRSKLLFAAIGNIYDCFISEDADDIAAIRDSKAVSPTRFSPKMKVAIPAAACLCVIAVGAYALSSRRISLRV